MGKGSARRQGDNPSDYGEGHTRIWGERKLKHGVPAMDKNEDEMITLTDKSMDKEANQGQSKDVTVRDKSQAGAHKNPLDKVAFEKED